METWTHKQWKQALKELPEAVYYLYTPMCGTCAVASKMLDVIAAMKPDLHMGKADLNYVQEVAVEYEIESVPCLLIQKEGKIQHKIYAFHSVPYLLEKLS